MYNQLNCSKINNLLPKKYRNKRGIVMLISITSMLMISLYLRGKYVTSLSISKVVEPKVIFWSAASTVKPDSSNRIFFHETSGRQSLNFRQTCAVESAAKENPGRPIQLFMQTNVLNCDDRVNKDPWFFILSQYSNIQIILFRNETDYFANTPLENWHRNGIWRNSSYWMEHFSDYIRILSLLKGGGGLYMDLDFITLQPLNKRVLWNFLPIEDKEATTFTQSIFHFEAGHRLVDMIIQKLAARYDPKVWAGHGPSLITEVMVEFCGFKHGNLFSNQCNDVQILPSYFFFPIPYPSWRRYFNEINNETMFDVDRSYAVHVWNKMSSGERIALRNNELYTVLARKHCPLTFSKLSEFKHV